MPKQKFTGKVGRTILETEAEFETVRQAPPGAPNVVYIVLDDLGFAQLGCYGSNIQTPNIDRLAGEGLRYNNFHTTAICSATRASLLTGANHHAAGVASVIEVNMQYPNALGYTNPEYATAAEILHEHDYDTIAVGKWHLAENSQASPSGPFENWPLGKGFDHYYGFLQGEIDQYHPTLFRDNTLVDQPKRADEGYHLSEDLTDNALAYLEQQRHAHPEQPFFLYLAYGATHAPHHAPREYIDKYKGQFDQGWDATREAWFARQKELGVVPQDARLNPRNHLVKAWADLNDGERRLYARYMEAFAGFLDHTDEQIGRVIEHLRVNGQLDNTIVVLLSDNGASSEGGQDGSFNTQKGFSLTATNDDDVAWGLENYDKIGGEFAFNHYPAGWANAGNTPFQWYKVWTHEGGVRDPLIIRYPAKIKDPGSVRGQFHHVSDVTPAVLELIGVEKPAVIKGVAQKPLQGVSLAYTLASPDASSRKTVQYFEQLGNRAIYRDGWKASVNHAFTDTYEEDVWELYHVEEDFSESVDLAEKHPEKLAELQQAWEEEAEKYGVFPLMPLPVQQFLGSGDGIGSLRNLRYPTVQLEFTNVLHPFDTTELQADTHNHRVIAAEITRKSADQEGVLIASGDRFGGYSLYIQGNKIRYVYNLAGQYFSWIKPERELPLGDLNILLELHRVPRSSKYSVALSVNGAVWGETEISRTNFIQGPFTTIKANRFSEVSPDYEVPFVFTGEIKRLRVIGRAFHPLAAEELAKLFHAE
ncbi:MAG: arylsulfatase [Oscillospiraceae bacterium]|jgi:arylsulfatase|nr:arylsulfatase [Oscillospiraceae bacterium]